MFDIILLKYTVLKVDGSEIRTMKGENEMNQQASLLSEVR